MSQGEEIMGEIWTRYILDNGQRMSRRQSKKVTRLEEEILDCIVSINGLEEVIRANSEEIDRIKKGGEKKPRTNDESESIF